MRLVDEAGVEDGLGTDGLQRRVGKLLEPVCDPGRSREGAEKERVPSERNCCCAATRVPSLANMELTEADSWTRAMILKTLWSFILLQVSSRVNP